MTRDLRRQALESHKTVSRKKQSKISSSASSAANSRPSSNHGSRQGSDDEDDGASDGTAWSVNSLEDLTHDEPGDESLEWKQELSDRIEEIIERKRSTVQGREIAINAYIHYLMRYYANEEIASKMSQILPALLKSVKGEDSEKETCLALKAIALSLITAPSESAYDTVFQAIKKSYMNSESLEVKAAAIHTLGAVTIYGGASDSETEEIMDELLEIIESDGSSIEAEDSTEVVTAALEEWGSLATFVDDLEEKTEAAAEAFVEQLDSSSPSVQIAAGENIALLFEKSYSDREDGDEPPTEEEDEEGYPIDSRMVKRYDVYRQIFQLKHKLASLSTESSKRISKKTRKSLRSNFSDVLTTVEHPWLGPRYSKALNEDGNEYGYRLTLQIHKSGSVTIDHWWKLHRLQSLRRVLGSGFVTHYVNNEVVLESLPLDG